MKVIATFLNGVIRVEEFDRGFRVVVHHKGRLPVRIGPNYTSRAKAVREAEAHAGVPADDVGSEA